MRLVRYNPWQEIDTLQRQLTRLFDESLAPTTRGDFCRFHKVPRAELSETEAAIILKLEVPGMESKDLEVEVTEDAVSISGERQQQNKDNTRSEFHYGQFHRVISLPARIQNTNVKAEYKDGVLNLTLPKKEDEKNKVVKVNLEAA
ncbi:MAG: Hsp20/alpha crystallin family protein [Symploca sp. SIO2E9]|nr:Hsp20/alpha crystallin family protein [Symploca sp. SIO2E9]